MTGPPRTERKTYCQRTERKSILDLQHHNQLGIVRQFGSCRQSKKFRLRQTNFFMPKKISDKKKFGLSKINFLHLLVNSKRPLDPKYPCGLVLYNQR